MADVAFGAVNLVLGLIQDEARLLGGVREDLQFIMQEMESMNNVLRHLVANKGSAGDYQLRPWMKQVMELAFDSRNCVELYTQSGSGRCGWLPWAMVARHRVITRIRELKIRAREISERQARYGIASVAHPQPINATTTTEPRDASVPNQRRAYVGSSNNPSRRAILDDGWFGNYSSVDEALSRLKPFTQDCYSEVKPPAQLNDDDKQQPQSDGGNKDQPSPPQSGGWVEQQAPPQSNCDDKQQPLPQSNGGDKHDDNDQPPSSQSDGGDKEQPPLPQLGGGIKLQQPLQSEGGDKHDDKEQPPLPPPPQSGGGDKQQQQHIRVVIISVQDGMDEAAVGEIVLKRYRRRWRHLWSQELHVSVHRPPILSEITKAMVDKLRETNDIPETDNEEEDRERLADKLNDGPPVIYSLVDIYLNKAFALLPRRYNEGHLEGILRNILAQCCPDVFCMKMLLHALYYNPDTTEHQLKLLNTSLGNESTDHGRQDRIMAFCYQALPNNYKNCLWYSTVFTRGISMPSGVRRASLLRRWVAQGLITQVDQSSAEDEAEHCFEAMLRQKLIVPSGLSGARKVKSCIVHSVVADLIDRESSTVEDLLLNNQLPLDLDLLYSIRNGMQLHPANSTITRFLNSLSSTSRLLLTVLDLEGRKGLKANDLHTVCKIHKLKYLSLRNTGVAQLPKQIGQLKLLETLDIRGTRVQVFHTALPMLKHLLAGCIIDCPGEDIVKSKESFSTVCVPHAVATMEKMEILSRVKVSNSAKELNNIGDKLEHLKKLGVVLSGKKASLKDLFLQVDKLHRCLRSLSIRMDPPGNWDSIDVILLRPPKLLESLHICSIRSRLPPRIKELHHLAKITLRDTFLNQHALDVLSMLKGLRYLRLCYHSFAEGALRFVKFENLMDLVIEDDIIVSLTFGDNSYEDPNNLENIVWSFTHMEELSRIHRLESLTHLKLNGGTCNPQNLEELKREVDEHSNRITFTLNQSVNSQGSRVVGAAR
ncbi:hypothetical protein E2562_003856 [Oryza meyeriana var. granulata]|uniref:Uncharacterized protein n=1 Tax=Oryza meyeriana var. granulata TaxID=110450 RepID=A0A6G1CXC0_9ORYZ|nr:hypothetical protein E2562_003856 [Oryza meyeriana var. granulata]